MSFSKKILLVYSLVVVLAIGLLSIVFYYYSSKTFEKNSRDNMQRAVGKMSDQLERLVNPMEFISMNFIANGDFREAMSTLSYINREDPANGIYIIESERVIKRILYQDSVTQNFHRVNIFNKKGDFFTSDYQDEDTPKYISNKINKLPWLKSAEKLRGKNELLAPYYDLWGRKEEKVFGLVRTIEGEKGETGYIEVQMPYKEIEKIFNTADNNVRIIVITRHNKILFQNNINTTELLKYYLRLAEMQKESVELSKNSIISTQEIVAKKVSEKLGVTILMIQDKKDLLKPFKVAGQLVFGIGLIIMMISLIGVYGFSRYLTKPIKSLKESMENVQIDNLPDYIPIESTNNEIEALNASFQDLRKRLKEAIDKELETHSLRMQANFDALQAQINPHFLYNVLNIISAKGMEYGNEEIGEMCDSIAAMLRYSTATTKREATVREEIEHVNNYLLLMKKRFERRLEFTISVNEELMNMPIPKIVLQPLVENALHYGFNSTLKVMNIYIEVIQQEDTWMFWISDNGDGFDKKVLETLREKLEGIKENLSHANNQFSFEIGGMGIVSTYARLCLFYKKEVDIRLENLETGGASIKLSGRLDYVPNTISGR